MNKQQCKENLNVRLKPHCGYWKVDQYPIGGDFARVGFEGLEVCDITYLNKPIQGCDIYGYTNIGEKIAFNSRGLEVQ